MYSKMMTGTMMNILVVEDSPTILYTLERELAGHGHQVITATDGEQALQMAFEGHPDIILLDLILPKINGYQVCRQLKSNPGTASIPVVMLTSKDKDKDRHWGLEQGADGYLTKPVSSDDLLAAISQFVSSNG
jgi:twitching motility two-component system response regulator PilH